MRSQPRNHNLEEILIDFCATIFILSMNFKIYYIENPRNVKKRKIFEC